MKTFFAIVISVLVLALYFGSQWDKGRPVRAAEKAQEEKAYIESARARAKKIEAEKLPLSVPVELNPGEKMTIQTHGDSFRFITKDDAMWYVQITTRSGTRVSPYTKEHGTFDFENHNWCRLDELNAYEISAVTIWNPIVFKNKGMFFGDRKAVHLTMAVEFPDRR